MSYLKRYAKRLKQHGETATAAHINNTIKSYDKKFITSPSYSQVDIDGEAVDAIVNRTNNYDEKLINFRHSYTPIPGSIITFKDDKYLLMETDEDEIYRFGKMRFCNHIIELKFGSEEVFVGYDNRGRPLYEHQSLKKEIPCVVTSKTYSTGENAQLPLPDGKLSVFMKHITNSNIQVNNEFDLFDRRYVIVDIDFTKVKNGDGVIELIMERKVSS